MEIWMCFMYMEKPTSAIASACIPSGSIQIIFQDRRNSRLSRRFRLFSKCRIFWKHGSQMTPWKCGGWEAKHPPEVWSARSVTDHVKQFPHFPWSSTAPLVFVFSTTVRNSTTFIFPSQKHDIITNHNTVFHSCDWIR